VSPPSVFASWAHGDPGWSDDRACAWEQEVSSFVTVLRSLGIDVDIDLYHLHDRKVDWSRWGPAKVQSSDIVLGIVSPAWRARLEGLNAPTEGAGAVAEADALLGTFGRDQDALRSKLVLVVLPSMRGADAIPARFHGIARVTLDDLSPATLTPLLHLLLGVPMHEVPPLGTLPDLVPLTDPAPAEQTQIGEGTGTSAGAQLRLLDQRINVLHETLSRIPAPEADEGPHLPLYRAWTQLQTQLADLERERDGLSHGGNDPAATAASTAGQAAPDTVRTAAALPRRTTRQVLDMASPTPGAPDHWMLYDGMLLLHLVVAPVPDDIRHPAAGDPRAELEAAVRRGAQVAHGWPDSASLLLSRLQRGWSATAPHAWGAGRSSTDAASLAVRPTAAAVFSTKTSVLTVDRTWPTAVVDDRGRLIFHAAREPEVAAELLISLRMGASLLWQLPGLVAVDVALVIGAAPSGRLVSSQRAVSGGRFGEPHEGIQPTAEVPSHHTDGDRFSVDDLRDPYRAARAMIGPWLTTFRDDDLLARLRDE
jgi:hypothetical protein